MDVKAIVAKLLAKGDEPRDIKERHAEGCSFRTGFVPEVGDILVLKDGSAELVGTVNRSTGACDCCALYHDYDDYKGYYPVEYWGPSLFA